MKMKYTLEIFKENLIPLLGSTTNPPDVALSEAKEKTSLTEDNIV